MISVQNTSVSGGRNERIFSNRLEDEGIAYEFGELKAYGQRHPAVFIVGKYAVSFKPFSTQVAQALRDNKLVPQTWHPSELTWRDLSLGRRLPLHP